MNSTFVLTEEKNQYFIITLNRPEKSNAYHRHMALEIKEAFLLAQKSNAAAIIFKSNGKNFCAGADLDWMKSSRHLAADENLADMRSIKDMYEVILNCHLPIIGFIQGAVRAGGVGLVSCCDWAFAKDDCSFAINEKSLGLTPGIISPIVEHKIGIAKFEELSQRSTLIDLQEAKKIGLIQNSFTSIEESISAYSFQFSHQLVQTRLQFAKQLISSSKLEDLLKLSAEIRQRATY